MEPVLDQLGVPFAELFLREAGFPHQERSPGNIQRDPRQRLVHRRIGSTVAGDATLVAQRLRQRLAERDRTVLGGVMLIDMEIALDLHRHVDQRMARKLFDHVIEEADAGFHRIASSAIEIDRHMDGGFRGVAFDSACAHGRDR